MKMKKTVAVLALAAAFSAHLASGAETHSAAVLDTRAMLVAEMLPTDCPVIVTVDDESKFVLTLTGDITGGLPLPSDLGAITIDLNGWTIRGTNGVNGTTTTAGGNGGAAITIAGTSGASAGATAITVKNDPGVQLWENGPYFAKCNVGARKPEEYGYYFWWGDTVGYRYDGSKWVSAKDGTMSIEFSFDKSPANSTYNRDNAWLKSNGWIGEDGNLVSAHDAATAHLGAPWRMMTKAELEKLVDTTICKRVWTTNWAGTGKAGYVVTGVMAGYSNKSVFFPAAGFGRGAGYGYAGSYGFYWSSTPDSGSPCDAWSFFFDDGIFVRGDEQTRSYGWSVRPVRGFDDDCPVAIIGGNGGDGNPAGKGSPAVVDATGAEVEVTAPAGLVTNGVDGVTLLPNVVATTEFAYDGTEKRPVAVTNVYIFAGDVCATKVGAYTLKITPAMGYAWGDGSTTTTNIAWKIVQGTVPPGGDPDPLPPGVDPDDPGQREDPTIPFSKFDYVGMYDGETHTIDTNALKQAWTAAMGAVTVGYSVASNGAYQATAFAFKDVGVTSFWYKVTSANYKDVVKPCKVATTNRPVTVTSGTKLDFVYDGEPHAYTNLMVTAGSFVAGEGIATSNWATVTAVVEGEVPNTFDYAPIEGTKLSNYDLTVVTGKIAVVSPDTVVVTVTGHVASVVYDGLKKSVSGYDVVSISKPLYKATDFKFVGQSSTNGINAGAYPMGLKSADFVNTNAEFSSVVFIVTDGKLVISQAVNAWTTEPAIEGWTYGETAKTPVGAAKFGAVSFSYDPMPVGAAGDYTMTASVAGTANYTELSKTVDFAIAKAAVPPGDDPDPLPPGVDPDDPGQREDPTIPFSKFDYVGKYDGAYHTIDTNALVKAYKAELGDCSCMYARARDGEWAAEPVTLKDVGVTSFWYKVTSANYSDVVKPCKVAIANRCVTLTSGTKQWTYDGTAHSNMTVTVGGDGFVAGEGVTTNGFATITDVGSVPNSFSYAFRTGTLAANYAVTCVTGTLTVVQGGKPEPPMLDPSAWGTVTYPKPAKGSAYLKQNANATWKAKSADACVFAGWEWTNGAPEAAFLSLSENERRNKSLKVKVGGTQVKPTDVGATWARIDEDRIQSVELTPSNLAVVCRSYVTASVSGLPGGLKFDKKSLAITGAPKKDETKTVKVSVKNASGYTWKENWTVTVRGGKVEKPERIGGSCLTTGEPVMLWGDAAFGKVKGSKVYVQGKKASIKATPAKGCIFIGWYEEPWFETKAEWLPKGWLAASQSVVVPKEGLHLFARFVELRPWAVGTFDGVYYEKGLGARGSVTFTVSAKGVASGKTLVSGVTVAFKNGVIDDCDESEDGEPLAYVAHPVAKDGTKLTLRICPDAGIGGLGTGGVHYGERDAVWAEAVQNGWKVKGFEMFTFPTGKDALLLSDTDGGNALVLSFGAKGAVKMSGTVNGTKVSAKSQVLPTEWGNSRAVLHAIACVSVAPKKGLEAGFCKEYRLKFTIGPDGDRIAAVEIDKGE